ncbi:3-hydroxyacyl-CoA dehydrogenase family protein [Alicyclobacillus kakegawensis]|uniref:3-hydroxyacyl-CoA dehydrogenase family protein n=1 Tax=Alicyclobacillus kakegawensis TaxID=392012 RepID=UPI000836AC79|nr:3-hydroxyacyl-CoA dehydrogenase family protein [Alicyclobacillus kakegawensis]
MRIGLLGLGTMGSQFATVFLEHGYYVIGVEPDENQRQRAEAQIRQGLRTLGNSDNECTEKMKGFFVTRKIQALAEAEFILEAVPEDLSLKREVMRTVSHINPNAILSSNTSAFSMKEVFTLAHNRERTIGTHWFNPPHLVPGVEVIAGPDTSEETLCRTCQLLKEVSKIPVQVADYPGFVVNRIQMAMVQEAIRCVEEGIVPAEQLDLLVRATLGFRLVEFGPLTVADWAGLDVYENIFNYLTEKLGKRFECPRLLKEEVDQGRFGVKSGAGFFQYAEDFASLLATRDQALNKQRQVWEGDGCRS